MILDEKILKAKILIIDDNTLNVHILKKILSNAGYINIFITTDSTKAVGMYKDIFPDLVLIDFNMPELNGIQVMEQMADLDPNSYLPALMLTAEEDETLRAKAFQAGAKDFLRKPYERLEVLLRSRNIIEVRMLYNQVKNDNRSLEEKVEVRTEELQKARIEVVVRLAKVAEYRDEETGEHIMRMSHYCQALAKAAGLGKGQVDLIFSTTPLHDIGKIAIPDAVLLKNGKLDDHEYEIMKNHTTLGAQMLSGADSVFLKMAETIALTHHEKYDGTGYPKGLKGEEIPLLGRICAICDVFDALTSERSYKRAWGFDEAMDEIKRLKGIHFDPQLTDLFISITPEIRRIYDEYK